MKKFNYNHTIYACFIGYMVQAIVNNFVPLLFLTFRSSYGISLNRITLLVTFNFSIQLIIDLVSVKFIDKIGYRASILIAHACAAAGLIGLTVFPELFSDKYIGLLAAVAVYAIGGGLIEVLVSPIVEACPTEKKDAVMSLLHSFYCWGYVAVVLVSTLFFRIFGLSAWKYMAIIWALVPILNAIYFTKVPMANLIKDGEKGLEVKQLFRLKAFWVMMLLMVCAGACEQAVSQWASAFAESGLGVSKTVGDLAGPMMFAVLMGSARAFYGKCSERIDLERFMLLSGVLCFISYLLASLSSLPMLGLIGCGLCGLSVGILWPGTFSLSARTIERGGTAMFAFLALAGDLGCSGGPTFVGIVSGACGDNLKKGILAAVIFPVILICLSLIHI